ncbi:PREDICTED: probable G-protein coupled receptor 132 [Chrysochloris asiatica]|uniref:Probable G-protein coupled receptor 132 n=1 Tax=Chrysochloris asiatica TaxID=185453 RepID=A0A9B0T6Z2_CHRAS|nr:PREDICTED: probable G-protein coupled receptor 132 [Chrysochloris asiatica]
MTFTHGELQVVEQVVTTHPGCWGFTTGWQSTGQCLSWLALGILCCLKRARAGGHSLGWKKWGMDGGPPTEFPGHRVGVVLGDPGSSPRTITVAPNSFSTTRLHVTAQLLAQNLEVLSVNGVVWKGPERLHVAALGSRPKPLKVTSIQGMLTAICQLVGVTGAAENSTCAKFSNDSFEESRVFLVVVYSAVCALGLPANLLTAWLTLLQVLQGNVLAIYLFCLAFCELLYISTLPLWVTYIQNQHRWTLGLQACKVTAYIFFCNIYVSILFLCCISCDRFVAVVYALESRGRRHQKTAIFISVCVFLLVGVIHVPLFYMTEQATCYEAPMDSVIARYHYSRFAFGFAIPFFIIGFTNHQIIRSTRLSRGLSAAQKAKVKHFAVAIVLIFLVCFAPYHLVLLIKAIAFSYYSEDQATMCAFEARLYTVSVVFLCLSTVNSVADPIIYVLATDHSRQKISRMHKEWTVRATKTDLTKLTSYKDSEEIKSPTALLG